MYIHTSIYNFGDIVYLKTDTLQLQRIVTDIEFSGSGCVSYFLNCGAENTKHYEFEICKEKNELISIQ